MRLRLLKTLAVAAGVGALLAPPAAADVVVADDHIVQGRACVGIDCFVDENFGTDVLRLKENNLRIRFDDTSAPGAHDWEITANESADGGLNFLGVRAIPEGDELQATFPLRVHGGAPDDALRIEASGVHLAHGSAKEWHGNLEKYETPDGGAILRGLEELPIWTYRIAGIPDAEFIGPTAADFHATFGVGEPEALALNDLAGVAITAVRELDPIVDAAKPGAAGPAGPKGPQGDPGPAGATPPDFNPSERELVAFTDRLAQLEAAHAKSRKQHRKANKRTKKVKRAIKRLRR